MGRRAERVYTDPNDIAVLEKWVNELAVNAKVRITLEGGSLVEGVVTVTPTVQVFFDSAEQQGMNGVVRLFDSHKPDWDGLVWLGDIRDIEHLDSVRVGTSRA